MIVFLFLCLLIIAWFEFRDTADFVTTHESFLHTSFDGRPGEKFICLHGQAIVEFVTRGQWRELLGCSAAEMHSKLQVTCACVICIFVYLFRLHFTALCVAGFNSVICRRWCS